MEPIPTIDTTLLQPLPPYLQNSSNWTVLEEHHPPTKWDDATWILTSAFIIFTMQSGFGLLESGSVSQKNEVNIMVKNAIDVLFGGVSYWMFGYGLSFGMDVAGGSNYFVGVGDFFVDASNTTSDEVGNLFAHFFFHASFATTATTIVSGAMAERTKLEIYIIFSFLNTVVYCIPAHWMWGDNGWLKIMGVVDIAGAGSVHMVGGVTGLVATLLLKPRTGRFIDGAEAPPMGSATNAIFGLFMLWWGWLGFNCGSTYGVTNFKWILAARSAVATITASMGGGIAAIFLSYVTKRKKFEVNYIINGVLGALVAISALCALAKPWQGLVIGMVGAVIACVGCMVTEKLGIDDPVGVVPVHALSAVWGLLAVGVFGEEDTLDELNGMKGLMAGGGFALLGVQALACVAIIAWSAVTSFIILYALDVTVGLRVPLHEELLGADIVEHSLNGSYDKTTGKWCDHHGNLLTIIKEGLSVDEYMKTIREVHEGLRRSDDSTASPGKRSAFGFRRSDVSETDVRSMQKTNHSPLGNTSIDRVDDESTPVHVNRDRPKLKCRRVASNGNNRGRRDRSWTEKKPGTNEDSEARRRAGKGLERTSSRDHTIIGHI
ncbi:putative ammonium transporter 2 [Asterias rubens]|uniref:putative ammonium transporter 2 n=1 Tax=Asterias rubens TaxID=7604 RepID=UPI0014558A9E|nr:putative ammonium transporter 2 [Asterias rubens]XP_033641012.1 putative ammonium transporter 2 [Asterias rubens]XP_033641013.1 putative ammonium transporter 2 [Asterias rubens]XP_033641014.1 putative ammonium transporter 2 [Asterias rubens]